MNKEKTKRKTEDSPSKSCDDQKCPEHGNLKLRGRTLKGVVISAKAHKTVTVEWSRLFYIRKYERYEKRKSVVKAYNPLCIDAKEGDKVIVKECRPLSKTKNFVVIKKIK